VKDDQELGKITRLTFLGFDFLEVEFKKNVEVQMQDPEDGIIFKLPRKGAVEVGLTRGQSISGTGPLALTAIDARTASYSANRQHLRFKIARQHLLRSLPERLASVGSGQLKFHQKPNVDFLSRALTYLIETSFDTARTNQEATQLKLLAIGDTVTSTLLDFWPNNFSDQLRDEERRVVPRQVKLAMDIIDADPFEIYSLHEIARCCGVSVRALQYGFRNFTSRSVREYIFKRRVKRLRDAAFNPAIIEALKAKIGVSVLRNTNRLQEKFTGTPALPWDMLG
jgi:AraC-like DNA-binding protein